MGGGAIHLGESGWELIKLLLLSFFIKTVTKTSLSTRNVWR